MRVSPVVRLTVAVVGLFLTGVVNAQVLKQIPSDAQVVVKINDLAGLSDKLGRLANQMGLSDGNPQMADPLLSVQAQTGVSQGVRKDGDLALAVFDAPKKAAENAAASDDAGAMDKVVLIVVPVADYAAFIGNFPGAQKDGALDVVKTNTEQTLYVVKRGDYAAMSPSKEIVNKRADGWTPDGAAAKFVDAKDADFQVFVNMKGMRAEMVKEWTGKKDEILMQIQGMALMFGGVDVSTQPAMKALINRGFAGIERLLTDTRGAYVAASVDQAGIALTSMGDFEPESYMGGLVSKMKNTDAPLLAGLPEGDYAIVAGAVSNPAVASQIMDDVVGAFVKELNLDGDKAKAMDTAVDAAKRQLAAMRSSTMGWKLDANAAGPLKAEMISVITGDAKAIMAAQKQSQEVAAELTKFLVPAGMDQSIEIKENAATIDGVTFTRADVHMQPAAQDPNKPAPGPGGLVIPASTTTMMTGAVDDQHILSVNTTDEATLKELIASVRNGQNGTAKNASIEAVAKHLPASSWRWRTSTSGT